jgi:hypothetical protein
LAKHNEDGTGVRMVFCFTDQSIASHTAGRILTVSVAGSMAYIVLRGKYVEITSQVFIKRRILELHMPLLKPIRS